MYLQPPAETRARTIFAADVVTAPVRGPRAFSEETLFDFPGGHPLPVIAKSKEAHGKRPQEQERETRFEDLN